MTGLALDAGEIAIFIENFARPVDLASLPAAATNPTNLAIDVAELADRLFSETPLIKLTEKRGQENSASLQSRNPGSC